MDFLRRLAPPRESDAGRAFAVLPSRFALPGPLLAVAKKAELADDDTGAPEPLPPFGLAPEVPDTASQPEGRPTPSAMPSQVPQHPVASVAAPGAKARATFLAGALPRRQAALQAVAATTGARERDNPSSPGPDTRALRAPAAAPAAAPDQRGPVHAAGNASARAPLSPASLAQRRPASRDEDQVVHVTIGRIDVVANTVTAPPVRHTPQPREPSLTLAEYLRGNNRGHR